MKKYHVQNLSLCVSTDYETNDYPFSKDIKHIKDKDMQRIRMKIHHFHISLSLSFWDIQRIKQGILTQTIFSNKLHGLSPIKSEFLQL